MNLRLELVLALKAQQGKAWVFFLISCVMPRIRCSPLLDTHPCAHTQKRERGREKKGGRQRGREGGREKTEQRTLA